jgi:hypothetical protein
MCGGWKRSWLYWKKLRERSLRVSGLQSCGLEAFMRSLIDWLSEFYGPKRNPYLRLDEANRSKVGIRATVFFLIVAVIFAAWGWLRAWIG